MLGKGLGKLMKGKKGKEEDVKNALGKGIAGMMKGKKGIKLNKSNSRDFDADSEGAKEFKLQEAMDRAFASMLKEVEIRYILNILKEKKGDGKLKPDQIKITEKKKYYD
jgi:hypothetical protein